VSYIEKDVVFFNIKKIPIPKSNLVFFSALVSSSHTLAWFIVPLQWQLLGDLLAKLAIEF